MADLNPNDIIGFRRQTRYTAFDYRAQLALKADEVRQFRLLCTAIDDEEEYLCYIIILMYLLQINLKQIYT